MVWCLLLVIVSSVITYHMSKYWKFFPETRSLIGSFTALTFKEKLNSFAWIWKFESRFEKWHDMLIKQMSINNFSFTYQNWWYCEQIYYTMCITKNCWSFFFFASQYSTTDITYTKEKGDNFFLYTSI